MPKRYYCDYCNKSFQDHPRNRYKHMKGFLHLRNKEMHYNNVQMSPPPLQEQQRLGVFSSSASGEELLQQWLAKHPEVVKRFNELTNIVTKNSSNQGLDQPRETDLSETCKDTDKPHND